MEHQLAKLISEHNLDAYVDRFLEADIDLQGLAGLLDTEIDDLARRWELRDGARARLRTMRDRAKRLSESSTTGAIQPTAELAEGDAELVARLPTPLARAAREVLSPTSDRTNTDVSAAIDVLLRALALVCQADYFHSSDWYDLEVNEMFPRLEQRPSYGTWCQFVNLSVKSAQRAGHRCFLRELPDTWRRCEWDRPLKHETGVYDEFGQPIRRGGGIGRIEWLIHHRNALFHHRVSSRDLEQASLFRRRCLEVFREYRWLGRYELWVGAASKCYLLQGLEPQEAKAAPSLLSADRDVVLRRPKSTGTREWETLPLPPLLLAAAALPKESRATGSSDSEIVIFSEMIVRRAGEPRINYTSDPFAPGYVSVETGQTANELRRLQGRKSFPCIGRDSLVKDDLARRIRAATARTMRVLETSGKFRKRLHVHRAEYESSLRPWINSTVPMLGLAAEAGAGKTGILAAMACRWVEESTAPVLFVLANQHQVVRDLDRLLQDALTLARDVTVEDVCRACGGLVVMIDGLNEHPGREDLLHRICTLSQATLESVNGPRFAVTWRTEDDAWVSEATSRRQLWWAPENVDARIEAETTALLGERPPEQAPRGTGKEVKPEAQPLTPELAASESGPRTAIQRSTDRDDPFVRIGPMSDSECAEAWRRYREDDSLEMCPDFEWQDIRRHSPGLARRLRNPLWMRVLMECMHGRPLPDDLAETDIFSEYFDLLRTQYAASRCGELLDALGRIMFGRRELRITMDDLERECWELVHPAEGQSALPALERRGVLSSIDGRSFTFAVERMAEQLIGEHVAGLDAASRGDSLAALAVEFARSKFSQGHGVIQEALHQRVRALGPERGDDYLFEFIDACPAELAVTAAAALERRIIEGGEASAATTVERLLEDRTESDLEVALTAATRLSERHLVDLEAAFLAPFVTDERIRLLSRSIRFRRLLQEYLSNLNARMAAAERDDSEPVEADRAHAAIAALRAESSRTASSEGLRLLAMGLVDAALCGSPGTLFEDPDEILREAIAACRKRVELADAAEDPADADDARRQLSAYLRLVGDRMQAAERIEESEAMFLESLAVGQAVREPGRWDACPVLWDLADLCEQRGQLDLSIANLQQCLAIELRLKRRWHACQTMFRLGRMHRKLGNTNEAEQLSRRALEIGRLGGSQRQHAEALEWFGDAMREADKFDEALTAYGEALAVGKGPPLAEGWSAASVFNEIARVHAKRGDHELAVQARRDEVDCRRGEEDRRALVIAIEFLGHELRKAGQFKDAIEEYLESHQLGMSPEPIERWRPSVPLHWAARCHQSIGEHAQAIEIRQSLVRQARSLGDRADLAKELDWLACALRDGGRFDEAALAFGEAYETGMHPEPLPDWDPSEVLWRHANMASGQGDHEGAVRLMSHACDLCRRQGDRSRLARNIDAIGDLLMEASRFGEALQAYLEAHDAGMLPERVADWSPGVPLSGAARALGELGRLTEAVDMRNRAVAAFGADGNRTAVAVELDLLGDALAAAGRDEEALQAYAQAIETGMNPERAEDWSPAVALADSARLLGKLERWDEAAEFRKREAEFRRIDGDRRGLAVALEYLGAALAEAGRPEEALEKYLESRAVGSQPTRVADWTPAVSLDRAAELLGELGRWEEAVDLRRQETEVHRMDGDRRGLAVALEYLGVALVEAGFPEEALARYDESSRVGLEPTRVEEWTPAILHGRAAEVLGDLGRWEEAIEQRRRSAAVSRADGDRRRLAIQLDLLGDALKAAERHTEALEAYLESIDTGMNPERVPDWSPAVALADVATLLGELERWDEAIEYRRREVESRRADGNRRGLAVALEYLGTALEQAGHHEEALERFRESTTTGMEPTRVENWTPAISINLSARVLGNLGRWEEAVEQRLRAAEVYRADANRAGLAVTLDLMGDELKAAGKPMEALKAYLDSIDAGMTPERAEGWSPAVPLEDAAAVLSELERWEEAVEYRTRAAEEWRIAGDRRRFAIALESLGAALEAAGRDEEALRSYIESHSIGMEPERVESWIPSVPIARAARVLERLERWGEAAEYRKRAIAASQADGDRRRAALSLEALGSDLRELGDAEGAISAYLEAHRTGMEPDPVERWNPAEPLVEAASLALQSGDRERAVSIANQALEVIDSRAPADDTRWSAGLELRATMTLGRALGDLGSPVAALEDMERGRASAERATASTDTPTWMLELCEEWYRLQSTLLDSIGDRDEARKAERHADELRERLGPEDPEPA